MHIVFDSHCLDESAESEAFNAYRLVLGATEYAKVTVVLPERWCEKVPSLLRAGATLVPVAYDNRAFPKNRDLEYMYWLYSNRASEAMRPHLEDADVIHRLNPNAIRYPSSAALRYGVPFVVGPLGGSRLPSGWVRTPMDVAQNILKDLDRVRCHVPAARLSRTYRRSARVCLQTPALLRAFPSWIREKCVVTGTGVDVTGIAFTPIPAEQEPTVLYVGRLVPHKGVDLLLHAMSTARRPFRLRVVGDGPGRTSIERIARQLNIASRVDFVGRVSRASVPAELSRARVCCFPGVNESFGITNIEAMAAGRPVVVADWEGPSHVVSSGAGVRVPVTNPRQFVSGLANALDRLLEDEELCASMGVAGRRHVTEQYDWPVVLKRFRAVYEEVASAPRSRGGQAA